MSDNPYDVLNDKDLLAVRDMHLRRADAVFRGEPVIPLFKMCNISACGTVSADRVDALEDPELWVRDVLEELAQRAVDAGDEATLRLLIVDCIAPFFSSRYIDRLFGAEVWFSPDTEMWVANELSTPVGTLERPDIAYHPVYIALERAIRAFAEADVRLPYFMPPSFGSPLYAVFNLYGARLLEAVIDCPESVHHDLQVVADVQVDLARRMRRLVPAGQLIDYSQYLPGYGSIAGCCTQLLSAEMYRDVFMSYDEKVLAEFPIGGVIHLCGSSVQHISSFRAMRNLRAVEVVYNKTRWEHFQQYFTGLRDDQVMFLPADGLDDASTSSADAFQMIERFTGGRRVVVLSSTASENPPLDADVRRVLSSGDKLVDIASGWAFVTDPHTRGEQQRWFADATGLDWRPVAIDSSWTQQGYSYHGIAWYTVSVPVPQQVDSAKAIYLVFHSVDGCATVWIDGRKVGEQLDQPERMWNRAWGLNVTDHVGAGRDFQLTVMVEKNCNAAGIWRPVELISDSRSSL